MLDFWLILFTMKLYSRKDIFKKQLLFIVFKEKYIINYPLEEILLNQQPELISKCRHENKNMLASVGNSGKRNYDSKD